VTRRPIANAAASVHRRLLNKARDTNRPFNELLQYFAMERFLYRLSESPHADKFVLKGALMFKAWEAPLSRPTMDIDLLGQTDNSVDAILAVTKDMCLQDVEPDGLAFDATSLQGERITEDADYEGVRIRFQASLGTARLPMQLDVGFGDVVVPSAVVTEYPTLLDLPAPRLSGYSRETAVAEKFEAMVKLGVLNSRLKDFFDIWLLSRQFDFDGPVLAMAITETFSNRGTEIPQQPVAFTDAFVEDPSKAAQWGGFIRRNRLENVPEDLGEVVGATAAFLGPIANALAAGRSFEGVWKAPGPWS
jgi:hypothetical protein